MTTLYTVEQSKNNILCVTQENQQKKLVYQHDCVFDTTTTITVCAAQDSLINVYCVITNCGKAEITIDVQLSGPGAQVNVYGVYVLNTNQHLTITTKQHHQVAHTCSSLSFNGVLTDNAQVNYKGTIFVDKKAPNTQAAQNNKTILLSKQAQAQSIPTLEVLNNDVQCAHGSAVGQLDEQQLWYAQTRGLSETLAQRMLLESFLNVDNTFVNQLVGDKIKKMVGRCNI